MYGVTLRDERLVENSCYFDHLRLQQTSSYDRLVKRLLALCLPATPTDDRCPCHEETLVTLPTCDSNRPAALTGS